MRSPRPATTTPGLRSGHRGWAVLLAVVAIAVVAPPPPVAAGGTARTPRRVLRPVPATPVLDPPPATYRDTVAVTLACATAGAAIHFTTDGSAPTAASPRWDGHPIVIANYELSADPWYAVHPDHVEDAAQAFAWVYRNIADLGSDPSRVYLFGQSAGGHLVALLGADPSYLQAAGLDTALVRGVVAMSGVYDLGDLVAWPANPVDLTALEVLTYRALFTLVFGTWQESTLDAASPAAFVRTSMPPFRIIHAWADLPGFAREAVDFHDRVAALGQPYVDLVTLAESDIPPAVLELGLGGHVAEIYAINTRDFDSASTRAVVDFVAAH